MEDFTEAVREHIRRARQALDEAVAGRDSFAISLAVDELDDALRLARDNGVEIVPDRPSRTAPEE